MAQYAPVVKEIDVINPPPRRPSPRLERVTFKTSRLAEFCGQRELTAQTGHDVSAWPLVILKELVDNALDAAEEAETAPEIYVQVSTDTGEIIVSDNGPGIPAQTVVDILDYAYRVSSREAYVSPTRGAQGNAFKTIVAMPFALHGKTGSVTIEALGCRHTVTFRVDQLRQEPAIDHHLAPLPASQKGSRIIVHWPDSACSILADAKARFLQIADDFGWLNPHLRLRVRWDGVDEVSCEPSDPGWRKWRSCDQTSAHWYDQQRLERYIAALVSWDRDRGRDRTVREFVQKELRGFSGSAKQRLVLEETGLARSPLSALFNPRGEPKDDDIAALLAALKRHSRAVKPQDLGLIGKEHLLARFKTIGGEAESFKYQKVLGETQALPWIVETAFGWCPALDSRRLILGVNASVALLNPFRSLTRYGGEGLEALLSNQYCGRDELIISVLHFTCPRAGYTDRGKTAIVLPGLEL